MVKKKHNRDEDIEYSVNAKIKQQKNVSKMCAY